MNARKLALLLAVTFATYWPTLRGEFIWDDVTLVRDNRLVQAPDGLNRFWFTTEAQDYYPLTSSLWWLEWRMWGKSAAGYRAVNLLLHAADAVLIWLVLRRLRIPGAWLGALLFSVHPVNVSTVAQISEQKNTLSMLFFALSILWYVRFDEENKGHDKKNGLWYGLSLAAFLLALLSKTAVVMLPVVLLGCVWWLHGRLQSRDWLRTAPFFALSLLLGLTTVWFQYHRAMTGQEVRVGGFFSRLAVAGLAPWFYLWKAVLPLNLCLIYPQWNPGAWDWSGCLPGIALAGSFALLWSNRNSWGRPLLFGLGYFVVMLFPVLGFFDQGFYQYSMVADHWQYYSIAGITALAGAGAMTLGSRLHRGQQQVAGAVAAVVVIALAGSSWQRCLAFHDEETLFRDNLVHNPSAWVAHNNLGTVLLRAGNIRDALTHYEQALQLRPDYAEARGNLGLALFRLGRVPEAIAQYRQSIQLNPDVSRVHNDLGIALAQTGKIDDAIAQYEQALGIRPDYAEAHNNLGIALVQMGKIDDAIAHYEQALRINPEYAEAHNNLGSALARQGRLQEAVGHWEQALRIKPDYAGVHYNVGVALERVNGNMQEAIDQYKETLRIDPNYAGARYHLANALARSGQLEDAVAQYQEVLRLRPDDAEARLNLGAALAKLGRTDDAIQQYHEALRIQPDYAAAHNSLANALARAGRADEAIDQYQQALKITPDSVEIHYNLAVTLEKAGRVPEAIDQYQQALKLRPDLTPAKNALARLQPGP